MKTLKYSGLILLALIVTGLVVSFFLPDKVTIVRQANMNAPPGKVFSRVNQVSFWQEWLPLAGDSAVLLDPGELVQGEGAAMCWSNGAAPLEEGCLSIIESILGQSISFYLEEEGGKSTAKFHWLFEPDTAKVGDSVSVLVTLTLEQQTNHIFDKLRGLLPEGKWGLYLEEMLAQLKQNVEMVVALPEKEVKEMNIEAQKVLSIRDTTSISSIGEKLRELYTELSVFMSLSEVEADGPPITIYHRWDPDEDLTILEAALPVEKSIETMGRIRMYEMPGGKVAMAIHYGPFSGSDVTHSAIELWIRENDKKIAGAVREVYVTDPATEPDTAKWETWIYYPLAEEQ